MNKVILYVLMMVFGTVSLLPAAASAALQEEIDYLLSAIKTSNCVFVRNGSNHDPAEAVQHITKKYKYLKKRITTIEDFIKGAATGSSMSGKPYLMICDGVEMTSADWLRAELKKYRDQ